jgi:hypothetical protein
MNYSKKTSKNIDYSLRRRLTFPRVERVSDVLVGLMQATGI